ncbi:MAG: NifB/NifX family molybdenum-iron cluster-binding protein [Thermoanaerobaculia bacterium]
MKVAVASDDRVGVAEHFGLARGFVVYSVTNRRLGPASYRAVEAEDHECSCTPGTRPVRHQKMIDALSGCDVVIARGMGAHMYDDLVSWGLEVALTDVDDAAAAAALYVARSLPERTELGCGREPPPGVSVERQH